MEVLSYSDSHRALQTLSSVGVITWEQRIEGKLISPPKTQPYHTQGCGLVVSLPCFFFHPFS